MNLLNILDSDKLAPKGGAIINYTAPLTFTYYIAEDGEYSRPVKVTLEPFEIFELQIPANCEGIVFESDALLFLTEVPKSLEITRHIPDTFGLVLGVNRPNMNNPSTTPLKHRKISYHHIAIVDPIAADFEINGHVIKLEQSQSANIPLL